MNAFKHGSNAATILVRVKLKNTLLNTQSTSMIGINTHLWACCNIHSRLGMLQLLVHIHVLGRRVHSCMQLAHSQQEILYKSKTAAQNLKMTLHTTLRQQGRRHRYGRYGLGRITFQGEN